MDMTDDQPTPQPTGTADADLVLRVRTGDRAAFGELWRRHYRSGVTVARSMTNKIDADDLVQEAYTRIFQSIQRGGGPTGSFRAYLFTTIRNAAATWGRGRMETPVEEFETIPDPSTTDAAVDEALDRSLTHRAFRSLPSRWQEVLWYTEIEQMKPSEVAPLLGMSSAAVAQLSFRAREGLRAAWIQAHIQAAPQGSACRWTIDHLGSYARKSLSSRDQRKLETHLSECARCTIIASEAEEVSQRLALVVLPLAVGAGAATAYLATLQGAGTPIVALAAAQGAAQPGAAAVGAGGTGAAVPPPTGGGASGSGGSGSGGSGGSTPVIVGAVAAGVLIAAGVAAAAILPGVLNSPTSTQVAPPPATNVVQPTVAPPPVAPTTVPSPAPSVAPTTAPSTAPTQPSDPQSPFAPFAPPTPDTPVLIVTPPGGGSGGGSSTTTTTTTTNSTTTTRTPAPPLVFPTPSPKPTEIPIVTAPKVATVAGTLETELLLTIIGVAETNVQVNLGGDRLTTVTLGKSGVGGRELDNLGFAQYAVSPTAAQRASGLTFTVQYVDGQSLGTPRTVPLGELVPPAK